MDAIRLAGREDAKQPAALPFESQLACSRTVAAPVVDTGGRMPSLPPPPDNDTWECCRPHQLVDRVAGNTAQQRPRLLDRIQLPVLRGTLPSNVLAHTLESPNSAVRLII
jgi:hypothetical protein